MSELSDRLKKARIDAGLASVKEAVDFLGVRYPTYAAHENGNREFDISDAQKYARRYKVSLDWLLTGSKSVQLRSVGAVPILGRVSAGYWLDVEGALSADADEESRIMGTVPADPNYPLEWQYCFRVDGNSINKTAKSEEELLCVDIAESGILIEHNNLVIVERYKHGGQMLERTAKRVMKTASGLELWPDSDDEEHQKPIVVDDGGETTEVIIKAKVIKILRDP